MEGFRLRDRVHDGIAEGGNGGGGKTQAGRALHQVEARHFQAESLLGVEPAAERTPGAPSVAGCPYPIGC